MKINTKLFLFCLFILAVGIKLITAYYLGNKFTPTLWEYEDIAMNIINGKGFLCIWDIEPLEHFNIQFRSIQEPFFPIWCAMIYYVTNHSIFTVLILQILYASLIPIAVYYITYRIYDIKTAIISSICSVFVPGIVLYSSTKLHHMPLYSLFFCLALLSALNLFENFSNKNQILLGLVLGVGLLIRSTTIFIIGAIFLWLWCNLKVEIKKKVSAMSKILLITGIIIMPWVIRNYLVHNRLLLFQSSDGYVFYIATNPNANGTLYLPDGRFQLAGIPQELLEKHSTLTEMEFRDLMKSESWKFVKQDPLRVLRLCFLRFSYFWWPSALSGKAPGYEYPEHYIRLYKIYYAVLLSVFLYQVFFIIRSIFRKDNYYLSKELLILLSLAAISIPHTLMFAEGRHRFAIEPLLLIIASRRIVLWSKTLTAKLRA